MLLTVLVLMVTAAVTKKEVQAADTDKDAAAMCKTVLVGGEYADRDVKRSSVDKIVEKYWRASNGSLVEAVEIKCGGGGGGGGDNKTVTLLDLKVITAKKGTKDDPNSEKEEFPISLNELAASFSYNDDPTLFENDNPISLNDDDPINSFDNDDPITPDNDDPTFSDHDDPTSSNHDDPASSNDNDPIFSNEDEPTFSDNDDPSFSNDEDPTFSSDDDFNFTNEPFLQYHPQQKKEEDDEEDADKNMCEVKANERSWEVKKSTWEKLEAELKKMLKKPGTLAIKCDKDEFWYLQVGVLRVTVPEFFAGGKWPRETKRPSP